MPHANEDFAIYFAMMKAGYKRRPKETPVEYARPLVLERLSLQRRYCDAFDQWKFCKRPECRRCQNCRGDAAACLKLAMAACHTTPKGAHGIASSRRRRAISARPSARRGYRYRAIFMK
jgi:hypothetical protein